MAWRGKVRILGLGGVRHGGMRYGGVRVFWQGMFWQCWVWPGMVWVFRCLVRRGSVG